MTTYDYIMLVGTTVQLITWFALYRLIKANAKDQEETRESLSRHWREHKDDYWEVRNDHNRLAEALGMEKMRAVPSRYVKSGETK